ncbi:hypothetical protein Golax_008670 [Gossypium laxum]|uniref:AB hydrolase-1 domain-containing protein n=1 Tax=Gossypium laxum TaxID=34288 RepID=A0A7J9AAL3_9ROSI|nr:hypothetical protein [Gossypium laxum]
MAVRSPLDSDIYRPHPRLRETPSLSRQVIAIDQLGQAVSSFCLKANCTSDNFDSISSQSFFTFLSSWGGPSRPNLHAKALKVKTEAWFVESFEERRRVKNLSNLIILGHSFGGYIASKYALKHPEHVQDLILVGPAGFSSEPDSSIEWLTRLRETWKGAILNRLWDSNFTPQKIVRFVYLVQFSKPTTRNQVQLLHIALDWSAKIISLENCSLNASSKGLGPWGPKIVHRYTATRFNPKDSAEFVLAEEQNKLLTESNALVMFSKLHSGVKCRFLEDTTKFHFFFLSFFSVNSASEWKVPTTFIYGTEDWVNYQGAQDTTKNPNGYIFLSDSLSWLHFCHIQGGHFVFLENTEGFHSAVSYVHVGDFSHLTLTLNPCLKAWNQLRIKYCNFFTHTFLYNT